MTRPFLQHPSSPWTVYFPLRLMIDSDTRDKGAADAPSRLHIHQSLDHLCPLSPNPAGEIFPILVIHSICAMIGCKGDGAIDRGTTEDSPTSGAASFSKLKYLVTPRSRRRPAETSAWAMRGAGEFAVMLPSYLLLVSLGRCLFLLDSPSASSFSSCFFSSQDPRSTCYSLTLRSSQVLGESMGPVLGI